MGMLTENDSLPTMFGDSLYAIAQVSADDEVKLLAPKIEKPREALQGLVGARTKAADKTVIAEAARDRHFDLMQAKVEVLEKKVDGVYPEEPKKVAVFFKSSARKVFNSSVSTRDTFLEDLSKAVGKAGLHADLKAAAREFVEARAGWIAALAAYEAAQDAEAEAIEAVTEGRRALIAGMIEVHGLLRAKFSTNVKRVEGYFRKRQKRLSTVERAQVAANKALASAAKARAVADKKAEKAAKAAEKAKSSKRPQE